MSPVLFPYMREQISSITSHFAGDALILPMIDCRNIKLDQPIVFNII
ncbi:hypothetical protein [uncultured Dubosiella sp.]|nr:hypothetical protein [uncultured Dubosiella sp.]